MIYKQHPLPHVPNDSIDRVKWVSEWEVMKVMPLHNANLFVGAACTKKSMYMSQIVAYWHG